MTSFPTPPPPPDLAESAVGEGRIVVLLVDDQPIVGEAVRRAVAAEGDIEYHYCRLGSEAIAVASALRPTVIMQDLVMPDADGMSLITLYQNHPALKHVPTIVLSSKEDAVVKSQAFAAGAVDYLVKLPDSIELIARIRHHSRAYTNQVERDAAYRALSESKQQLLQMNEQLRHLSDVDGLTGLSNRRSMDAYLEVEWARAVREGDTFSLLMIDVDNFKVFNDTFGHLAGDEVLKKVGEALRACAQRPADLAARYGGEEFAMILPSTSASGAERVAEKVRALVASLAIPGGADSSAQVTVSIGAATTVPARDTTSSGLIEAADTALYQAKRSGKNRAITLQIES